MKKQCSKCGNDFLHKSNVNERNELSEVSTRFVCSQCQHKWYEIEDRKPTRLIVGPHWLNKYLKK